MAVVVTSKDVTGRRRSVYQEAKYAIRDVYDAIVELVTNADDRYQRLESGGRIEIEVERHRGDQPTILRVRDFADGMTGSVMDEKLSSTGGRHSGMESGKQVRGTNSRGAKHVAALGRVTFESIASDEEYHASEISAFLKYDRFESKSATPKLRRSIGIPEDTGTLVTIHVHPDPSHPFPQHDKLCSRSRQLVALRDILADRTRTVVVRDKARGREIELTGPHVEGTVRVKETFSVPGYPDATAKLVIKRANRPFDRESNRFRLGGILVKSRHAIIEATLFDPALERDPHASWFFGRLTCPYIDVLWNAFDDCFEADQVPGSTNPVPIMDPLRKEGLDRGHPFVEALFRECLKRLRPLVEEERRREESERASIESRATRRRLDALAKAASKFMEEVGSEEDVAREPDSTQTDSKFRDRGYSLSPPFTQMIQGHSQLFWLNVRQDAFPELELGATVQIECLSPEIVSEKRFCALEAHPTRENVLRAVWKVKAVAATAATGICVRVGPVTAECTIEVLETEADRYRNVKSLCFQRKRYRVNLDSKRKRVRILAPLSMASKPRQLDVSVTGRHFKVSGDRMMRPEPELGVAVCDVVVKSDGTEDAATITARLEDREASAEIQSIRPLGAPIDIRLEDISLGNQRYRWRKNVLEIASKHPSLARYLGPKSEGYPGQEEKHFRLLQAEIVADAVCAEVVSRNIQNHPEDYEDADWNAYYADYSKLMTQFLPIAHKLQCPEA